METAPVFLGVMVVSVYVFLWVGMPILLTSWVRKRREMAVKCQIALTDAIHWRVGAVVSPVVETPLWGPWRVRIAMPLTAPAMVGTILAVTHAVLSACGPTDPDRYRIVLTPMQEFTPEEREHPTQRTAERWAGRGSMATA